MTNILSHKVTGSSKDLLDSVKPCPFCGMKPDMNDPDTIYPSGTVWREELGFRSYHRFAERKEGDGQCYVMNCCGQAGGCGAEMHGDSKEEVLSKWNRRETVERLIAQTRKQVLLEAIRAIKWEQGSRWHCEILRRMADQEGDEK